MKRSKVSPLLIFFSVYFRMIKSEQEPNILYESFLPKVDRVPVEEQIKFQNKVIGICLLVLLVGAIALLCLIIL